MDEKNKYTGMDILDLAQMAPESVFDEARKILETLVGYKELRMMYACALKEVRTKFEVLDVEFNVRYSRNPINAIHTRLKSNQSILEKMQRRRIPFSLENLESRIQDVAGVRVICSYVDDIYRLSEALLRQDDVKLIAQKDYIQQPKPNGYRSLHIVVDVPVYLSQGKLFIPVEIQIRTVAMDFWATLEHGIRYKSSDEVPAFIVDELRNCADVITRTDAKMQEIFKALQLLNDKEDDFHWRGSED